MPHARVLLLVLVALLLPAATASATFDGSNGKVAYVDMQEQLFIDDPWDDQPADARADRREAFQGYSQ